MLIEAITCAMLIACQWLWTGSETKVAKYFFDNYYVCADEDSKNFVTIDDVTLPKPINCVSMMGWLNRVCHPDDTTITKAVMKRKVKEIVGNVKSGNWNYSSNIQEHELGNYVPGGRIDC